MPAPRIILRFNVPVRLLFMLVVFTCAGWPVHIQAMPLTSLAVIRAHDLDTTAHPAWPMAERTVSAITQLGGSAQLRSTAVFTATLAVNTRAAVVGSTLVYTLTLVNNSNAPEAFAVTDMLSDNLALIDASNMTVSDHMLTADGTMDNGTQQQFVIRARIRFYHSTVEHTATVRFDDQTQTVVAPVVRIASPGASFMHYLPLMVR